MRGRLLLIGGGARAGKSALALRLARGLGPRRTFVATAEAGDDEMRARIARHAAERGDAFATVEAPRALPEALAGLRDVDVVVVDCLTFWLANLLLDGHDERALAARVDALGAALAARRWHAVVVTNEVGMGVVPESALGRVFRDVAGRAHQELAAEADEVYAGVLGVMLRLKPGPVTALPAAR